MAIIPRVEGQENARLQPNSPVPIGDASYAGETGRTIEALGEQVFEFGRKQLEVQRENARQEGYNEIENATKMAIFEAETKSKDDGSDYIDIANAYVEPRVKQAIEKYAGNDPRLQKDFDSYTKRIQSDLSVELEMNSFKKLRDFNLNTITKNGNSIANNHRANPSELSFLTAWQNYANYEKDLLSTGGLTEKDLRDKRIEFGAALATQHVAGLDHMGLHREALLFLQTNKVAEDVFTEVDPNDAYGVGLITEKERDRLIENGEDHKIPVLNRTDGKPLAPEAVQALEMLDAGVKERLIEEQMRKLKSKTGLNVADLNAKISGLLNLTTSGAYKADQIGQEVDKILGDLPLWDLSPDAAKRMAGKLATIKAIAHPIEQAALTPTSQLPTNLEKAQAKVEATIKQYAAQNKDLMGGEGTIEVQDQIQDGKKIVEDHFKKIVKERNSDPVKFLLKHDVQALNSYNQAKNLNPQTVQAHFTDILTRQKQLEVPAKDQRLLSKEEASARAKQVVAIKDRSTVNKEIIAAERVAGKHFTRYWNELSGYNKTVKELKSVMMLPENTREQAIDAVLNLDGLKEATNKLPEAQKSVIRQAVQEKVLAPFRRAVGVASKNSAWIEMTNQMRENIERAVMIEANANPTLNVKEYVNQKYKDFVLEQFLDPSVTRLSDNKSAVLVPRKIDGTDMTGQDFLIRKSMRVLSRPNMLQKLGIPVEKNFESTPDRFWSDLASRVSWRNSGDMKGMILQATDAQGQTYDVVDKKRRPIYFSFQDLVERPRPEVQEKGAGEKINDFLSNLPLIGEKFQDKPYVPPKTQRNR